MSKSTKPVQARKQLSKTPTGINGFDEITEGGLPTGRASLICGDAGCGKTLFSIEFLVRGISEFNEPGVFITFEEKAEELRTNVASLGFDLQKMEILEKLKIDHVHIERSEIEETGEYDLEGLFIRLDHAIKSISAKRVVLDTIENLFAGLTNTGILRAELRRLFTFLKDKGVTALITGERGEGKLTRHGLEEYVSDCVIFLDHRVIEQVSTRRLRIVKYRGSVHGTNEYPFLIDADGISVLPVTSLKLENKAGTKRISSGIPTLDVMLAGNGFFKGSSILVSGSAGIGKTSVAAAFIDAACKRKERSIYFAFEESPSQIKRNMRSIGIDLQKHEDDGYLTFVASRPTLHGLEQHLVVIHKVIAQYKPVTVVLDPISNLISVGSLNDVKALMMRLIDFMIQQNITLMLTALKLYNTFEQTDEGVSSLVDTWITIRDVEYDGDRTRVFCIVKSRGMKHGTRLMRLNITNKGLQLADYSNRNEKAK